MIDCLAARPTPKHHSTSPHSAILELAPEKVFDDLAWLATQICCTPIALITLDDEPHHQVKSTVGLSVAEAAGEFLFHPHVLAHRSLFLVTDATKDERFASHSQVASQGGIRFFAGLPLTTRKGTLLGVLSVLDRVPRQLSPEQSYGLEILARQVATHLEQRALFDRTRKNDVDDHEAR
jgi:two-component system cell cycle sensor histidine kinase/response regulator CckA